MEKTYPGLPSCDKCYKRKMKNKIKYKTIKNNKRLTEFKETKQAVIDFAKVQTPWLEDKQKSDKNKMLSEVI